MQELTLAHLINGKIQPLVTKIDLPGCDGWVYMRPMASRYKDAIGAKFRESGKWDGFSAYVVAGCLCDSSGNRSEATDEQVQRLGELDCTLLDHLFDAAQRISGLTDEADKELEKN